MRSIVKNIPNFITSCSILAGCISIALGFEGYLLWSALFIFIAGICDFLDGFAARLLKVKSEFGIMLDSLADVISFGVAPAALMYQLLVLSFFSRNYGFRVEYATTPELLILSSSALIAVFSALRLARFNTTPENNEYFTGMPTPASALSIASLAIVIIEPSHIQYQSILLNELPLLTITFTLCILMVSNLKMLTLKFKSFSIRDNYMRYMLIAVSILLFALFNLYSLPFIFATYIVLSIIYHTIIAFQGTDNN